MNEDEKDRLRLAKLRALVDAASRRAGSDIGEPGDWEGRSWERVDCGLGVALHSPALNQGGVSEVIVYPRRPTIRSLGEALAWERVHHRSTYLNLVIDSDAGDALAWVLQRRCCYFAGPLVMVWLISERDGEVRMSFLDPLDAPEDQPRDTPPPAPALVDVLLDVGVEVVAEAGIIRGEVNGLEVARIAHGTSSWGVPLDEPTLEVGVGLADRELTSMMHAGLAPADQVARAAEVVRAHRRPDAPPHPLNRLVPERWLRAELMRHPERLGLIELRAAESCPPRANLTDRGVAMLEGKTEAGTPVVVAVSAGVDLDLVPTAADSRMELNPDAELWIVLPESDRHEVTVAALDAVMQPLYPHLLTVPDNWRSW